MSAKREKATERRLRFRRLRRPANERAVSPVVATLILILIAVAAAAALYLWLVGWQGSVTGSISKPGVNQGTITLGGSTSVYPFDVDAVTQYEQNNTGVTIDNTQGGTGAGMLAVCSGTIDIGAASSLQTVAGLLSKDNCPAADASTITISTVAYDAVDVVTQVANVHGLISISADTLYAIYFYQSSSVPISATPTTVNGDTISTTYVGANAPVAVSGGSGDLGFAWDQIPACVASTTNCAGSGQTETFLGNGATSAAAPVTENGGADEYFAAGTAGYSTCGWTVCAGPFSSITTTGTAKAGTGGAATDPVITVQRSDTSGTTQAFTARLLSMSQTGGGGADEAQSTTLAQEAASFTGCGSDGQLGSCGISATQGESGNPAVILFVSGSKDAIGYASDGLARAAGSGVTCQGIATSACGIGFEAVGQSAAVQPSLTSTGTIANAISDPGATGSNALTNEYMGWRPFEWVTLTPPSGLVASFLSFVLEPGVNIALASEAAEVSIYSI